MLAGLPGRFLFALDDGRGDVAAEDPDLCWRAPGTLLVAGVDTGLRVPVDDAVAVLLDAAEAFLALRAADGGAADGGGADGGAVDGGAVDGVGAHGATAADGGAWRAAELADGPARIAAALARAGWRLAGPDSHVQDVTRRERGLQDNPAAVPGPVRRDDGGVALVVAPLLGELTAAQVRLLADATPARGAAVVTPWRTVVLPDPRLPAAMLAAAGLIVAPGPAADVSACAGRPGCAKALADVRADARAALAGCPGPACRRAACTSPAVRAGAGHPAPRTSTPSRSPTAATTIDGRLVRDWCW